MKSIPALLAALFFFGANYSTIAADTNTSATWKFGPPHAAEGYVLVRLETAAVRSNYAEIGGHSVSATFQPIEFKYPGNGRGIGGGGADPAHNPFRIQPVETKIGKSFNIGMFSGNSIVPKPQQSIANLLQACADENDPKHLKLDLILSVPAAEATADWKGEHDYSHWFIELLNIAKQ
jgi:hypothetical protein